MILPPMTYFSAFKDHNKLKNILIAILFMLKDYLLLDIKMLNACEPQEAHVWKYKDSNPAIYHVQRNETIESPIALIKSRSSLNEIDENIKCFISDEDYKLKKDKVFFNSISGCNFIDIEYIDDEFAKFSKADNLSLIIERIKAYQWRKSFLTISISLLKDFGIWIDNLSLRNDIKMFIVERIEFLLAIYIHIGHLNAKNQKFTNAAGSIYNLNEFIIEQITRLFNNVDISHHIMSIIKLLETYKVENSSSVEFIIEKINSIKNRLDDLKNGILLYLNRLIKMNIMLKKAMNEQNIPFINYHLLDKSSDY